ncbi:MAG: lpxD [Gammaproteobacteria bacterium]|jgi:UDP-3-O-[3-hydroxymyristoyl] glucosamine N-acyltransferase|nr:lpxD [Gammaproteobacteria bacterium]
MKQVHSQSQYTLTELVRGLEDVVIKGNPNCLIQGVCTIHKAQVGRITFLNNPSYKKYLATTQASAVILMLEDAEICPTNALISRDPYYTYSKIAAFFDDHPPVKPEIHPTAVVGQHCHIDASVSIGANCVIGDNVTLAAGVVLGPGCIIGEFSTIDEASYLHANVTLYHKIHIGKRVLIASGTVIGGDGFGIAKHKGVWHKVPQLGRVVIEDDVEIGANCTIDRGAVEDTVLKKGAKLDNLIQIGHNVQIGEYSALAGCVGISGSTVIGKNCLIGGGVGFAGHLTIADNVMITGMTAVTKSIRGPGVYSSGVGGLVTNREWRKNSARVHRLDQLTERVKSLETILLGLTERKEI